MFARSVSFRLKPGSSAEFSQLFEKNVLPVLRKQKGFQDELTLVASVGAEALGISLWDLKDNAEAYARGAYPGLLKALGAVLDGTPQVHTYEVTHSTFHKLAAPATV
jgi:hypothetical protein